MLYILANYIPIIEKWELKYKIIIAIAIYFVIFIAHGLSQEDSFIKKLTTYLLFLCILDLGYIGYQYFKEKTKKPETKEEPTDVIDDKIKDIENKIKNMKKSKKSKNVDYLSKIDVDNDSILVNVPTYSVSENSVPEYKI